MEDWLIHHELERQARWRSDKTAMVFEGTEYTFAAFDRRVNRVARALRDSDVERGDRIVVHGHNHVDLYTLFFACSKLGAVYSPISTFQSEQNVGHICDTLEPQFVFHTDDEDILTDTLPSVRAAAPAAEYVSLDGTEPSNTSLGSFIEEYETAPPAGSDDHKSSTRHNIFWTSGTTGRPKAVVRDHRASLHFNDALMDVFPFGPDQVRLTINDLMFAAPYLQYGLPTVMSGSTNVILRSFSPETVYDTCQEHRVTLLMLAFTQGTALLDYLDKADRTLSLRAIHAIMPSAERAQALDVHADALYHIYATTEVGVTFAEQLEEPYGDPPTIGKPGRSADIRLLPDGESEVPTDPVEPGDNGELLARGDVTMTRYLEPEHQEAYVTDGWIHTGDAIEVTGEGDAIFVGRIDDRIRSGGVNVYPQEVESVLLEHPDVEDAFVVAVEDEQWGQRICTLVVTADSTVDTAELESKLDVHCKASEGLTDEMRPKSYAFVESLSAVPTGAVNKIDRGTIVSRFFA